MTRNALDFTVAFFQSAWRLMTSFYIPGTNVTPGALFLGLLSIAVFFRFIKRIVFSNDSDDGKE